MEGGVVEIEPEFLPALQALLATLRLARKSKATSRMGVMVDFRDGQMGELHYVQSVAAG